MNDDQAGASDVMTVAQAARRLEMTTEGVKAAIRRGKLPAERRASDFYVNGVYYVRHGDVEAYAAEIAANPNRGGRPPGKPTRRRTRAGSH
jgi:hypothetical protein